MKTLQMKIIAGAVVLVLAAIVGISIFWPSETAPPPESPETKTVLETPPKANEANLAAVIPAKAGIHF